MQEQQLQLARLLHQQYLGGRQEYFILLLNNHDPNQAARELQYYEYIAQSRATWLKNMRGNLAKLNAVTAQARQKNNELAALQAEQTLQKQSLLKKKCKAAGTQKNCAATEAAASGNWPIAAR